MRIATTLLIVFLSGTAQADLGGRIDLYGTNFTDDDASLTITHTQLFGGTTVDSAEFDAGAAGELGLRPMIWSETLPLVVGIDLSYFRTGSPQLDLNVTQVSVVGGLRAPRPLLAHRGRGLHPYMLFGLSGSTLDGEAELNGRRVDVAVGRGFLLATGESEISPFFAVGIEWQISDRFGLVAEYRQREFSFDSTRTNSMILPTENTTADGEFNASGISIGISWLFEPLRTEPAKMPPPESEPTADAP